MNVETKSFSGNPCVEFLHFPEKTKYEAIEAYCRHYNAVEIPAKYYNKGRYSILMHNLHYTDCIGRRHTAKAGMLLDGGSLPVCLWDSVSAPYASPYLPAFVIHDSECQHSRDIPDESKYLRKQLRLDADKTFKEMCIVLGAGLIMRRLLYRGVRIGAGWEELTR